MKAFWGTILKAGLSELTTEIGILNLLLGVAGIILVRYYMKTSHEEALAILKLKNVDDWIDSFNQTHKGVYTITLFVFVYFLVSILIASTNQQV